MKKILESVNNGKCEFCSSSKNLKKLSETQKDMIQVILPDLPISNYRHSSICNNCDSFVKEIFHFKSNCIEIEDNIHNYKTDSSAQINLEKIIGLADIEKCSSYKICRTCFRIINDDLYVFVCKNESSLLQHHQQTCLPEMDMSLTHQPVMCIDCVNTLQKYFNFIHHYQKNDQILKANQPKTIKTPEKKPKPRPKSKIKRNSPPPEELNTTTNDKNEENMEIEDKNQNITECSKINEDTETSFDFSNKFLITNVVSVEESNETENNQDVEMTVDSDTSKVDSTKNCDNSNIDTNTKTTATTDESVDSNLVPETDLKSTQDINKESTEKVDNTTDKTTENNKVSAETEQNQNDKSDDEIFNDDIEMVDISDDENSVTVEEDTDKNAATTSETAGNEVVEVLKDTEETITVISGEDKEVVPKKRNRYKRKLRSFKKDDDNDSSDYDDDTDSDFNPELTEMSSEEYFEKEDFRRKPARNKITLVHCLYCPHTDTSTVRMEAHMSICKTVQFSAAPRFQASLLQELHQLREQVKKLESIHKTNNTQTVQQNKNHKNNHVPSPSSSSIKLQTFLTDKTINMQTVQQNKKFKNDNVPSPSSTSLILQTLLTDSDSDSSVDSQTNIILKSLLKQNNKYLPSKSRLDSQKCTKSDQNVLLKNVLKSSEKPVTMVTRGVANNLAQLAAYRCRKKANGLKPKKSNLNTQKIVLANNVFSAPSVATTETLINTVPSVSATQISSSRSRPFTATSTPIQNFSTKEDTVSQLLTSNMTNISSTQLTNTIPSTKNCLLDEKRQLLRNALLTAVYKNTSVSPEIIISDDEDVSSNLVCVDQVSYGETEINNVETEVDPLAVETVTNINEINQFGYESQQESSTIATKTSDSSLNNQSVFRESCDKDDAVSSGTVIGNSEIIDVMNDLEEILANTASICKDITNSNGEAICSNLEQIDMICKDVTNSNGGTMSNNLEQVDICKDVTNSNGGAMSNNLKQIDMICKDVTNSNGDVMCNDFEQMLQDNNKNSLNGRSNNGNNIHQEGIESESLNLISSYENNENPANEFVVSDDDTICGGASSPFSLNTPEETNMDDINLVSSGQKDNFTKIDTNANSVEINENHRRHNNEVLEETNIDSGNILNVNDQNSIDTRDKIAENSLHPTTNCTSSSLVNQQSILVDSDSDSETVAREKEVSTSNNQRLENIDNQNSSSNKVAGSMITTDATYLILNDHIINSSVLSVFKCNWCSFNTRYFQLIDMHILTHFNSFLKAGVYTCDKCPNLYSKKINLFEHFQADHAYYGYKLCFWCVNCATIYFKKVDVRKHLKSCPRKGILVKLFKSSDVIYCMYCSYETTDINKSKQHAKRCNVRQHKCTETVVLE